MLMMGKLYTALRDANVAEDKATAAAEEVASFENRLAKVNSDLLVLKWMAGFNLAMTVAIATKIFLH